MNLFQKFHHFPPAAWAVATALLLPLPAKADWLQYRGPTQNGVSPETGWNAASPKEVWRVQVGKGTSSVTTKEGRAYTMGNVDGQDIVHCLDAKTGKTLWRHQYPMPIDANLFEGGPRATPVLDGDRVYAISHQGDLLCLNAASGKRIWHVNFVQKFGGQRPDWGYAGSPKVSGNLLLCDAGGRDGSTVALNKLTGEIVWKNGSDKGGYATPVVATLDGQESVVVFKSNALVSHALKDGRELWRFPWKTSYDVNAASPLVVGNRVFISSGYNTGAALLEVKGGKVTELWRNKNLRSQMNTPVSTQGHVFGIDGNAGGGNLVCLFLANGERAWQEKSVKGGALIMSAGRLIVLSEKGELVIAEASPSTFKPLSRTQVLKGRCWAQPTLDAGRLFLRDNEGTLACMSVQ